MSRYPESKDLRRLCEGPSNLCNRLRPSLWLLFAFAFILLPQHRLQAQQEPSVSVEVKVVNVLATVRDKHGQIVRNLNKDDFTLEEDGRPQTIAYFAKEDDLPLKLGLLVDTSLSQRRVLDQERSASHTFLDQMLRPEKDTAFILHFDREVELLQDFTSSRDKLYNALGLLETTQDAGNNSNDSQDPSGARHHHGGTQLYDAVYLASNELMKKQNGRKALIVLSDGVDRGSKESLPEAIEAAQRADTLIYSILFKGDEESGNRRGFGLPGMGGGGMGRRGSAGRYPEEPRPDGKKILQQISQETGGRLFEVSKKLPIDEIYTTIEEELRNQYSLGYTPDKKDEGGYHKIVLKTRDKDMTVQTRDGYFGGA